MNQDLVIDLFRQTIIEIIVLSTPMIMTALIVGLIISIFQTITSIQEATLAFVPKILAVFIVLLLTGSWMINRLITFTVDIFSRFNIFIFK